MNILDFIDFSRLAPSHSVRFSSGSDFWKSHTVKYGSEKSHTIFAAALRFCFPTIQLNNSSSDHEKKSTLQAWKFTTLRYVAKVSRFVSIYMLLVVATGESSQ